MSDQPEIKRTRRAKRRAEQTGEVDSTASELAAESLAPPAPDSTVEPARVKKKAKAKAKAEPGSTDEIRDRNRRLREKAAEKRRGARDRERSAPARGGLAATEMVDDAVSRSTQALGNFAKKHFSVIQWFVLIAAVGAVGWQIYSFRQRRETAKVSDALAIALRADLGRIGGAERGPEPKELKDLVNPAPEYPTDKERIKAADKAYRDLLASGPSAGMTALAKLGLASTTYDSGKYDEARKLYEEVKTSELAGRDADVKARATEGIGLSLEAKGDKDGALKLFRELENSDVPGFGMLGLYHQARVRFVKGERDKAKDLIKRAREKLSKQPPDEQQQYLDYSTNQLLKVLDPVEYAKSAAPESKYTPEQLEALQKQLLEDPKKLQNMLKDLGKGSKGLPMPAPAPASSGKP